MHLHPDRMLIVGGAEESSCIRRGDLVEWLQVEVEKGKSNQIGI
jgi:hypothetical protein